MEMLNGIEHKKSLLCNMCYRKMAQASSVDGDGNDQDVAALNKDADEEVCSLQIQQGSSWLCNTMTM